MNPEEPFAAIPPGVTLYLARHGETLANTQQRFSGKRDTPLTDRGREQAQAIGEILKRECDVPPSLNFVSSPLARAQATMRIVREVLALPPGSFSTDARLEKIDLGLWDQLTDTQPRALDPAFFEARVANKWQVRVPEGENYAEVAARACDWAVSLTADTFAVSHGALGRILRGLLLGLTWQEMSNMDEPQGVVFRIRGNEVVRLDP